MAISTTPLRVAARPILPCLMASALSPNSLRRQPCSAGTSAWSSRTIASISSEGEDAGGDAMLFADGLEQEADEVADGAFRRGAAIALRRRRQLGLGQRLDGLEQVHDLAGGRGTAVAALHGAELFERFGRKRALLRDFNQRVVLEHPAAGLVPILGAALAPSGNGAQRGEVARLAQLGFEPLPRIF